MAHNNGYNMWSSGSSPDRHDIDESPHNTMQQVEPKAKKPRLSVESLDETDGILEDECGDLLGPPLASSRIDMSRPPLENEGDTTYAFGSFPHAEFMETYDPPPPPIESFEPEDNRKRSFEEMQSSSAAVAETNGVEPDQNLSIVPFAASLPLAPIVPQAAYLQEPQAVLMTWDAIFFCWIKHPWYQTYRDMVKVFSDDRVHYPSWTDDIVEQVMARLLTMTGIGNWFICVDERTDEPLTEAIFDTSGAFLGKWRHSKREEIAKRIKQRFADDRRPVGAVPAVVAPGQAPVWVLFANRVPWTNPITTTTVCFGWTHCGGILRCREVVRPFASNLAEYPVWNVTIVHQVTALLALEGITDFLVLLNTETGRPCVSIHNGDWYEASNHEVRKHIRKIFNEERRRFLALP